VSEAVQRVGAARGKQVGAFANAVLRRLAAEAQGADKRALRSDAALQSVSADLRAALVRSVGRDEADALVCTEVAPAVGLRVRWGASRAAAIEELAESVKGAAVEAGRVSPIAVLVRGASDPQKLRAFEEGRIAIQEEGAQLVALSLGALPGESVLDACAGRGNKTALLAELVGPKGAVDAVDRYPQKLERLRSEVARLGVSPRATYAVDWTVGSGNVPEGYDRVLVDAPCSGTGTIARRPDLATRWRASDLEQLRELQTSILVAASERAKPGGAIVYAVCSLLKEEAEEVIARALDRAPWLEPVPFPANPAKTLAGGAMTFRLTPRAHGTDGYFVASLRRIA
jgi:16S rRNA (cytosine967-C5)-methyltransferase